MEQHHKLMLVRDLLDRLSDNAEQWDSHDESKSNYWADSVRRDMAELRRVCESIRAERSHDRTLCGVD